MPSVQVRCTASSSHEKCAGNQHGSFMLLLTRPALTLTHDLADIGVPVPSVMLTSLSSVLLSLGQTDSLFCG